MQEYIDTLTGDYNKITSKLHTIMEVNVEDLLEGRQVSEEIRHQMNDIFQGLMGKAQIDESSLNLMKKRKRFKFRIGRVKALERENLS